MSVTAQAIQYFCPNFYCCFITFLSSYISLNLQTWTCACANATEYYWSNKSCSIAWSVINNTYEIVTTLDAKWRYTFLNDVKLIILDNAVTFSVVVTIYLHYYITCILENSTKFFQQLVCVLLLIAYLTFMNFQLLFFWLYDGKFLSVRLKYSPFGLTKSMTIQSIFTHFKKKIKKQLSMWSAVCYCVVESKS